MTDTDHDLPSPRAALIQAYRRLQFGDDGVADTWIALARELRHGSATPRQRDDRTLTLHDVEGIVCVHGVVALRRSGGPGSWFLHTNDGTTCDGPANQAETDHGRRRAENAASKLAQLDAGQRFEDDPSAYAGQAMPATTRSDLRQTETTRILDVSRLRGRDLADGLDATAVIRDEPGIPGAEGDCQHCRMALTWVESGSEQGGYWVHNLTQQRVCPLPQRKVGDETYHPSPTHTFAEPL